MKTQYLPSLYSCCAVVLLFFFGLPVLRAQDGVEWAIRPQFEEALYFGEWGHKDSAKVKQNGEWHYINKNGDILGKFTGDEKVIFYISVSVSSEGLTSIEQNGKYGYEDEAGRTIIRCQFDEARYFYEGLAVVKLYGKYGYIDKTGNLVTSYEFADANSFKDGLAVVKQNEMYFCIDKTGKKAFPHNFEDANSSFAEGLLIAKQNGKWGCVDKMGKIAIPFEYELRYSSFSDGLLIAKRNGKWGCVDKTGKTVIPFKYEEISYSFGENLLGVKQNGKWGFVDKTGNLLIKPHFEQVQGFYEGLAAVKYNGKWGYIKKPLFNLKVRNKRFALVVGNDAYESMNPLTNAINDSKAIETRLTSLGFEVIRIENANKANFQKRIGEFAEKLKDGGTGLFYYAGHGVQFDNENYLVPTDADTTQRSCISTDDILYAMENRENAVNILILDACRSNARGEKDKKRTFAKPDFDAKGSFIAFSTSPENIALDGSPDCPRNSVYTCELLKNMKKGVKLEDVFKRTREGVIKQSQNFQIPWEHSSLVGEFEF